jgi:hypothetical protein
VSEGPAHIVRNRFVARPGNSQDGYDAEIQGGKYAATNARIPNATIPHAGNHPGPANTGERLYWKNRGHRLGLIRNQSIQNPNTNDTPPNAMAKCIHGRQKSKIKGALKSAATKFRYQGRISRQRSSGTNID